MTELIIGETYKLNAVFFGPAEYRIIAKSPVTGNFIGENLENCLLSRFTNDGRRIDVYGEINSEQQLIQIPKEIEVEYEFWVNFYKDGSCCMKHATIESATEFISSGYIETKKFTHKVKYIE